MARKTRLISLAALLGLLLPTLAFAGANEYKVDPVHSQVGFTVRHILTKVPGQFNEFRGMVTVDPEDVAGTLAVSGTVTMASIDTNNGKRDGHLKSPDFFDAENHPEMSFVSKKVTKKDGKYSVVGDLTMRGVTKEVGFETEVLGFATNPFTGTPMTSLEMMTTINRQDFGVTWNKTLDSGGVLVGDDVSIAIQIEASVPPAES